MRLGQTITDVRKVRKMTQEEFAEIFHVTRQTVSNWENEKNYPDLLNLIKRGNVTKDDLNTLNTYLNRFISLCNDILEREVDYFE